ncbi:hypothetical protein ACFZBE_41120, partial [Streptomyces sp. NPDC008061]|uniref:hypothetical protein n=1 Tax=Streptomyces sp. NPDC008061 TaxID=3364805 RepID=UPI0036E30D94
MICFEIAGGRHVDMEHVTAADFEEFMGHVNEVAQVYRLVLENPPFLEASSRPMTPGEVVRALASVGSHRLLAYADDRAGLNALVIGRHGRVSAAGPLSPGDLTAMVLAVQQRLGIGPGLETDVELTQSILGQLFPQGVGEASTRDSSASFPMNVEDRLVPGGAWGAPKGLAEALRAAGPASTAVVVTQDGQAEEFHTGQVTLYVNLGPDGANEEPRIVRVDPRALRPVTVLPPQGSISDFPQQSLWAATSTRMAVINAAGRPVDSETRKGPRLSDTYQASSLQDDQHLAYATAAATFERNLVKNLSLDPDVADFVSAITQAAWDYVSAESPEKLPLFGTNIRSIRGAISDDVEVLRNAASGGNLREQMTMLWNGHRRGLFDALQSVDPPLIPEAQINAAQTGSLISTGTSETAYLFMRTVSALGAYSGQLFDIQMARLALIAALVSAGHRTYHEVMHGVAVWAAENRNAKSLDYVDSTLRYRYLAPFTEQDLRKKVAENGLFPDEIARGLTQPDPTPALALPAEEYFAVDGNVEQSANGEETAPVGSKPQSSAGEEDEGFTLELQVENSLNVRAVSEEPEAQKSGTERSALPGHEPVEAGAEQLDVQRLDQAPVPSASATSIHIGHIGHDAPAPITTEAPSQPQPALTDLQPTDRIPLVSPTSTDTADGAARNGDAGESRAALSAVFLDAPRNDRSLATEHRYGTETESIARPLTAAALRDAAKVVAAQVGVRTGLENCVDLTEAMLRRLFPGGVRAAASVWDDSTIDSNRAESRLIPGGRWSPLTSLEQIVQALAVPDSVAVVLEQGERSKGHVNLYVNIGSRSGISEQPQIVRVDLQTSPEDLEMRHAVEELPPDWRKLDSGWREIRAGHGTRMIVIDPSGQTVESSEFSDGLLEPQSARLGQALIDAPTGRGYGAIGWEIEINDQPITRRGGSEIRSDTVLARHVHGFVLTTDKKTLSVVGTRKFHSPSEAKDATGDRGVLEKINILELVTPPSQSLSSEAGKYTPMQDIMRLEQSIRGELAEPTRLGRAKHLTDILKSGWSFTPEAGGVLLHPSIADPTHKGPYPQITMGVPIGGASVAIALGQDLMAKKHKNVKPAAESAREFAADVTAEFATWSLQRPVKPPQVPYLTRVLPGALEVEAYAWLMFSHASAWPLYYLFFESRLAKTLLPAALRNPFYALHETLSPQVKTFLVTFEEFIYRRFHARLLGLIEKCQQLTQRAPSAPTENVMTEDGVDQASPLQYLTTMVRGARSPRKVSQYEMVGMNDRPYQNLDMQNGHIPLALLELRLLDRMSNEKISNTLRETHEVAGRAYDLAWRFHNWDHARTNVRADRVLNNYLVRQMQELLPQLTRLKAPLPYAVLGQYQPFRESPQILSFSEHLTLTQAVADHAMSGLPLSSDGISQIDMVRRRLLQAVGPHSTIPEQDRPAYRQALHNLLRTMPVDDGPRPTHVAMADVSDPMRIGLERALADARAATPLDAGLINKLETQLRTWSGPNARHSPAATAPHRVADELPELSTGTTTGTGTTTETGTAASPERTNTGRPTVTTPPPANTLTTAHPGMTLGSLWKAPDNQQSLLPLQHVTTATLEIGDFIPHDLRNDLDALTNNRPADTT